MSRYAILAAASLLALVTSANAAVTTLYATDFEDMDTNASLEDYGFGVDGGTAIVKGGTTATTTHSGVQSVQLSVGASTNFTYQITPVTDFTTQPIIQAQASLQIASPSTGTANRSVVAAFGLFDNNFNEIAEASLFWDPENYFGGGANHYYLQGSFFATPDAAIDGFIYDLGAVSSSSLTTTAGFFNLGVALDYANGYIGFTESGQLIGDGHFDPSTYNGFSDADLITARLTTTAGGTLPRIFADDYIIEQSDLLTVPEPTTLVASASLLGLATRRRRA